MSARAAAVNVASSIPSSTHSPSDRASRAAAEVRLNVLEHAEVDRGERARPAAFDLVERLFPPRGRAPAAGGAEARSARARSAPRPRRRRRASVPVEIGDVVPGVARGRERLEADDVTRRDPDVRLGTATRAPKLVERHRTACMRSLRGASGRPGAAPRPRRREPSGRGGAGRARRPPRRGRGGCGRAGDGESRRARGRAPAARARAARCTTTSSRAAPGRVGLEDVSADCLLAAEMEEVDGLRRHAADRNGHATVGIRWLWPCAGSIGLGSGAVVPVSARLWELDVARTMAIGMMVAFHASYDVDMLAPARRRAARGAG